MDGDSSVKCVGNGMGLGQGDGVRDRTCRIWWGGVGDDFCPCAAVCFGAPVTEPLVMAVVGKHGCSE